MGLLAVWAQGREVDPVVQLESVNLVRQTWAMKLVRRWIRSCSGSGPTWGQVDLIGQVVLVTKGVWANFGPSGPGRKVDVGQIWVKWNWSVMNLGQAEKKAWTYIQKCFTKKENSLVLKFHIQ